MSLIQRSQLQFFGSNAILFDNYEIKENLNDDLEFNNNGINMITLKGESTNNEIELNGKTTINGDLEVNGTIIGVEETNLIKDSDNTTSITTETIAETLIMTTNSNERMRINSSGNVGIGTSLPADKLHINGSSYINNTSTSINSKTYQFIGQSNTNGNRGVLLFNYFLNNDSANRISLGIQGINEELLRINKNENIAMGSGDYFTPQSQLHIQGTNNTNKSRITITTDSNGSSQIASLQLGQANLQRYSLIKSSTTTSGDSSNFIIETTNNSGTSTERMRIVGSTGDVGIGTNNPTYKLEVNGDVKFTGNELNIEAQGSNDAYTRYQINGVSRSWATGIDNSDSDKFKINTLNTTIVGPSTGTNVMTMLTSGEVGIGTETPLQPLHVEGNTYINSRIGIRQSTPLGPLHVKQEDDDNGGDLSSYNQTGLIIERNGNTNKWSMSQNTFNDFAFSYNLTGRGYISATGLNNKFNFTGQHRTQMEVNNTETLTNINDYVGLIVISTGNYIQQTEGTYIINGIDINEALPKLELSTVSNDKKCFGIISNGEDLNEDNRTYSIGNFVSVFNKEQGDNRVIVNSLGEGGIWVCEENGAFENGDYITSSNLSGYGMKQNDDLLHNYTVGKITCNEDFSDMTNGRTINGVKCKFVGCVYVCG